jgi:uncharacterized protein YceH (UPF0502 family)
MIRELSPIEQRVLGVLIEKGYTTPEQYPLTLNATVVACNQKSCRDPILELDEVEVLETLDDLREKKLVVRIRPTGSRTDRYRHCALEELELSNRACAVLAELLLRGPQTDGELRQRANRMLPIENLAQLQEILADLRSRTPPLVRRLSPEGQRRGVRFCHALYPAGSAPSAEPIFAPPEGSRAEAIRPAGVIPAARPPEGDLADAIDSLRSELEELRVRVERIESRLAGEDTGPEPGTRREGTP